MSLRRFALPVLAVLLMASAAPVFAQTPMGDPLDARDARRLDKMEQLMRELRAIVYQGRDSGKPVVVQPAETDYQLQELTRRLADLEQSLTRMNGALETSNHDLAVARRDIESLKTENKALAEKITAAQAQAAAAAPAPTDAPPAAPNLAGPPPASASDAFAQARQLMLNGDYDGAEAAFSDYVARHGDTPKGAEARYWLGKTLTARSAYADAASAYIGAIRGWPQTSWAPDAVVELSRALIQLKKPSDACLTLGELTRRYPKAPPAVLSRAASARAQAKCAA